jgi:hypothetical protein
VTARDPSATTPEALVRVQREDFDVGAELAALTRGRPSIGGVTSFLGLVRDIHGGDRVGAMTLEHFPGMTERELERSSIATAGWSRATGSCCAPPPPRIARRRSTPAPS